MRSQFPDDTEAHRKATHLRKLTRPPTLRELANVPADEKSVWVSELKFRHTSVGWGQPVRDRVHVEGENCLLSLDGRFYERGLYAHSAARFELELGRKWKTFRSGVGLQDGNAGSVVFVVRGDGKELFRSPTIKDHQRRDVEVDVSQVDRLELMVEDAGDGRTSDWGVWVEPQLLR